MTILSTNKYECEEEVYDLYKFDDGRELCQDCLLDQFEKVGD